MLVVLNNPCKHNTLKKLVFTFFNVYFVQNTWSNYFLKL